MREYEALIITPAVQAAGSGVDQKTLFEQVIKKQGGKLINHSDMGKRQLGYQIKKSKEGHVSNFEFEIEPSRIGELNRALQLAEEVSKYMLVRKPKLKKSKERKSKTKAKTRPSANPKRKIGG